MQAIQLLKRFALLFLLLHGIFISSFGQDISWMKGLWKEESGTHYMLPPVKCINNLQITSVKDSSFEGLQITSFAADTTIKIMYNCTGLFTQSKAQFYRGNMAYKKNSNHPKDEWKNCEGCEARVCSLYVAHDKLLLLIANKDCDSICDGTITYYRDLADFDVATKQRLVLQYGQPQYTTVVSTYTAANTTSPKTSIALRKQSDSSEMYLLLNNGNLPPVLKDRTNKLEQTLQITSPNIEVVLLDDAEIDGDIVTLYHNNEEVLSHKTLGKEVIKYSFKADQQHTHHELVLVAENLGSIPPNTALMRIRAGDKKYELTTRANLHENAVVVIEYTGSE